MKPGPYLIWGLLGAAAIVAFAVYLTQSEAARDEVLVDGSQFRTSAILGGKSHRNTFEAFSGGDANAFMGGLELDFRGSRMAAGEAKLELFVMMGGIDLRIPDNWVVVNELDVLMGGIEDYSHAPDADAAGRLVLTGTVLMGGLQIRN
jgi:hypothetical protein